MSASQRVGATADLEPGKVVGAGRYAVGNASGRYFAVTRRCRHLGADLAGGSVDENGCLICPWHGSAYDVGTGRMVRGPQGVFAKVRGLLTIATRDAAARMWRIRGQFLLRCCRTR